MRDEYLQISDLSNWICHYAVPVVCVCVHLTAFAKCFQRLSAAANKYPYEAQDPGKAKAGASS